MPINDVYLSQYNGTGLIYRQIAGAGTFQALTTGEFPAGTRYGCAIGKDGDLYVSGGGSAPLRKQLSAGGASFSVSVNRSWRGMATLPNGDIYCPAYFSDLYKAAYGTDNFVAQNIVHPNLWSNAAGCAVDVINGDIYTSEVDYDVFRTDGGTTNLTRLYVEQDTLSYLRKYRSLAATLDGTIYLAAGPSTPWPIYKKLHGSLTWAPYTVFPSGTAVTGVGANKNGDIYVAIAGITYTSIYVIPYGSSSPTLIQANIFKDVYQITSPTHFTPVPFPTGVSAQGGVLENTISWTSVAGATSYNIYWSYVIGGVDKSDTKITGVTSPYDHIELAAGETVYYIVTAVGVGDVESEPSAEVFATPTHPPNTDGRIIW